MADWFAQNETLLWWLGAASVVMFVGTLIVLMGLYDDVRDMSSFRKLIIELLLTSLVFFWGYRTTEIAHPLGGLWHVGLLAILITPLWIAGVMNAVNFSDGLEVTFCP